MLKKVKYINPLINIDEIINFIKQNYKIKYWVTLKLPSILKNTKLNIDELKNNLYQTFVFNLKKNNIKFILGVIEDNYINEGYHAHILCDINKEEHVLSEAWRNALLTQFQSIPQIAKLLSSVLQKERLSIINIKQLNSDDANYDTIIINNVHYMFKNFGLNKRHGYFYNKEELVQWIETPQYKSFIILHEKKDFGLNFVIIIYALSLFFIEKKVSFDILLKLILEQEEYLDKLLNNVNVYLLENKSYIFYEGNSSEKINDLIFQVASELFYSNFLFVLKPSYSFNKKEIIVKEYLNFLKKRKIKNINYYDYILTFIKSNYNQYLDYANNNLLKWINKIQMEQKKGLNHKETLWEQFLQKTPEEYLENIILNSIDWILTQGFIISLDAFSQEYLVKKFKTTWNFYLNLLNKDKHLDLDINEYFFLFKTLIMFIERILKINNLLSPVKLFKNDSIVTYYIWSASNNKYYKNILTKLIIIKEENENENKNKNININFLLNFQVLNTLSIMFGTFFVLPKKWKYLKNIKLSENYTGGYLFNDIFKISSFVHHDEAFIGEFEPENPEEFINILNLYQEQPLILNMTYIRSKGSVISNNNNILLGKDRKKKGKYTEKEMEILREKYKNIWLKEIKRKKYWYSIYIDGRGRIYVTGLINYQNDKEIRIITQIYGKYNIDKKEEIKEVIEGINIEQKEMIKKELEIEKETKIMNKWIGYKDANTSCYQIATIIFGIKELYKKYYIEEKQKEIYDYYSEIIKKYAESKGHKHILKNIGKYRKAWKRTIMTQIYGAVPKTMLKYSIEGMKEQKIEENTEIVKEFIKYIQQTEIGVLLNNLKLYVSYVFVDYDKKTKEVIWKEDMKINKEIKKTLEVKCFDRKMSSIYCQIQENNNVISVYKKRMKIKTIEYAKEYIDIRKTIQAFFVNTVHFIDSGIAYKTIKTMLENNKGILCIHDCFGTLLMETEQIEEIYISIFKNEEKNLMIQNYYKNIIEKNDWLYDENIIKDKKILKLYLSRLNYIKQVIENRKEGDLIWKVIKNSNLIKNE